MYLTMNPHRIMYKQGRYSPLHPSSIYLWVSKVSKQLGTFLAADRRGARCKEAAFDELHDVQNGTLW